MEQELDIKQQLGVWLSSPEKVSRKDAPVLKDLALLYPYFQPLHLLLAKATLQEPEQNNNLATAALYTNGQLLHTLLHAPEELNSANFEAISLAVDPISTQPEPIESATIGEVAMDDQEVFDEIAEVNIKQEDDLVMENIVASDFFAFQESFIAETVIPDQEDPNFRPSPSPSPLPESSKLEEEPIVISKYDDDQLPYTFLWWLAKTRKEHQQIFQPYASPRKVISTEGDRPAPTKKPNELQQQYVEHIFHLQSPFDEDAEEGYSTETFRATSKGNEIIESFIKNDPQISPPKPEQIDNENKAKKSAEDHNDLVSETLAKIYIEQMLYDKAIETYEKLSLKFPEKRRYFADLIQSIEKKI